MPPSSPIVFADLIAALGGPEIDPAEIEWAMDDDAGRKIVGWIAEQLGHVVDEEEEEEEKEKRLDRYRAALKDIVLEKEEVDVLDHFGISLKDMPESAPTVPFYYLPPSRLKKHAAHLTAQTTLLQRETSLLHTRLRQTKQAMHQMSHTISSLRLAIERTERENEGLQERLGELSIDTDNAIASSISGAVALLDVLGSSDPTKASFPPVSALSTHRTALLHHAQSQSHTIHSTIARRLPWDESALQAEAARLLALGAKSESKIMEAEERLYEEELKAICLELEAGDGETLRCLMKEYETYTQDKKGEIELPNVRLELERAWAKDQGAILDLQCAKLDATLTTFIAVHTPLQSLHVSLAAADARTREAEALLGALGEEVEGVVDDVRAAQGETDARANEEDPDKVLEEELRRVVKELRDKRPPNAPPLVLLTRDDILTELRALFSEHKPAVEHAQTARAESIRADLRELQTTLHPLLETRYPPSPSNPSTNTTPPFLPPADVRALEAAAKEGADNLSAVLRVLEGEVAELGLGKAKGRTERKLGAFVDRWCAVGK